MKYWNRINSPIAIAGISIFSAYILVLTLKTSPSEELRNTFEEMYKIAEDADDLEKKIVVQTFVQEIAGQVREGLIMGFQGNEEEELKEYLKLKEKILIIPAKQVPIQWEGREKYVFRLVNQTEKHIKSVKLNYSYYQGNHLVDAETKYVGDIKILEPGEEVTIVAERNFNKEANAESDHMKIKLLDFKVIEI